MAQAIVLQGLHPAIQPPFFEQVVEWHNHYVEWIQYSNFDQSISDIFSIQTDGPYQDGIISRIVKMIGMFFASIVLLPLSLINTFCLPCALARALSRR